MPETRARSWWGWGWEDQALSDLECAAYGSLLTGLPADPYPVPRVADLALAEPRIAAPPALAHLLAANAADRAAHATGRAYRDVIRSLRGRVDAPPDLVAHPTDEADVVAILDWASETDVAVVPFGGGSSVVGGVEYDGGDHRGVVSLDLARLDRVIEIDRISRAALIQAGTFGPALEAQLRPAGLTLRHFPQSFEFSTLGGWLATRAGGHFATLYTHIDDLVESLRVVTPTGISESWRLPGSGAGPSPDRLFLGSEGTLGVITEAWMRLQDRPTFKRSGSVTFPDASSAFAAVRAIAQSGLNPANCRLLDPGEAALSGADRGGSWVLVLGVESAHHPVDAAFDVLVATAEDHGGSVSASGDVSPAVADAEQQGRDGAAEAWRSSFLRMPYVRDGMARMSAIVETFETAITWDRVTALYDDVRVELARVVEDVTGHPGLINCRLTHVYPDGAAPYFTVIAVGRRGSELGQWDDIKAASMEILGSHRATITHHHAVGRDHRRAYDRQRPGVFARALSAAKHTLDPAWVLNPGVLLPDPHRP